MKRTLVLMGVMLCCSPSALPDMLVLRDGTEMEVETYAVKGRLLVFTTVEGRARSVALSLVDLEATEEQNRRNGSPEMKSKTPYPEPKHVVSPLTAVKGMSQRDSVEGLQEVLDASGVQSIVSQIPELVARALADAKRYGLDSEHETIQRIFEPAFQPDSIEEVIRAAFAARADNVQVAEALEWLRSPVARRMAAMERSAGSPKGLQRLPEFAADLAVSMPSATRLEALQRLDEVRGLTEGALDRQMRILRAVLDAQSLISTQEARIDQEDIEEVLQAVRSKLQVSMKNHALITLLFTYRHATDKELAETIAYWETENGRWLCDAARQSLLAGITTGIEAVKEDIAQEVRSVALRR